jgi:hypothetical protein
MKKRHVFAVSAAVAMLQLSAAAPAANGGSTQLLWGDTHLHTSHSVDAYSNGNINADPETAYRFAQGLPVLHPTTRMRIRIERPLDFLVVADHAEMLELQLRLARHDAQLLATPSGKRLLEILEENPRGVFQEVMKIGNKPGESALVKDLETVEIRRGSWAENVDAAERNNHPGRFTALIGWEWSSAPGGQNLHRVVFTSSNAATAKKFIPFSSYESDRPEDLWRWLEKTHAETGADFVAIPHNSNLSNGLMFDQVDSQGRPIGAEYARTRVRWEPVMEVTQVKGTSETHPALSATDEFAGFEIRNKLLAGAPETPGEGAYARSALLRGLQIEQQTGVNPYKFGLIGSTDSHTGLSSTEESNFYGKLATDTLPSQRVDTSGPGFHAWEMSASGLAAVWATQNTREAIAAAFRRKEVYATTGTRIGLRVFGGFGFTAADAKARDIAAVGYRRGVPMGGDLSQAPRGKSPSLLIHAVRDPQGASLDRIQVVKGWVDAAGAKHEHLYDVAWSGSRKRLPDGRLAPVPDTVDLATARHDDAAGATQLATAWIDPDFDPRLRAFYYVRVLEVPTARHQVYDAIALGMDPLKTGQPTSIQERAYSSPIWYTP